MGEGAARGAIPPTDDAKIAATALQHGMIVATANVRHFEPFVTTINPHTA